MEFILLTLGLLFLLIITYKFVLYDNEILDLYENLSEIEEKISEINTLLEEFKTDKY